MKRAIYFLIVLICLGIVACAKSNTPPLVLGEMPIRMNLQPAISQGYNVSSVEVTIRKGDFSSQQDLTIDGTIASGTFGNLEPGTYAIDVLVYDGLNLIATGQGTGNVVPAQTTTVYITLQFVPGALDIQITWGLPYELCRRVLLVGNSHTYYNGGVDTHLGLLLADAVPQWNVNVSSVTMGGATLQDHLQSPNTISVIETGDWDLVILQEQSSRPMTDPDLFYNAATDLHNIIRQSGALTGLYMTWPWRNNPEMYVPIRNAYTYLGARLDALVIPAGVGFYNAGISYPSLNLYDADNSHASMQGTYLVACIMMAKIWNINPIGNRYYPQSLDSETAAMIQELAWQTVQNYRSGMSFTSMPTEFAFPVMVSDPKLQACF